MTKLTNWRDDPGMKYNVQYKKKFALFPVIVADSKDKIWLKNYYTVYKCWGHGLMSTSYVSDHTHVDKVEDISEQEYIVRKLTEGF